MTFWSVMWFVAWAVMMAANVFLTTALRRSRRLMLAMLDMTWTPAGIIRVHGGEIIVVHAHMPSTGKDEPRVPVTMTIVAMGVHIDPADMQSDMLHAATPARPREVH